MSAKSAENRVLNCPSIEDWIPAAWRGWHSNVDALLPYLLRAVQSACRAPAVLALEPSRVTDPKLMSILRQVVKIGQKFLPNQVRSA
jgi:hypothetical protein